MVVVIVSCVLVAVKVVVVDEAVVIVEVGAGEVVLAVPDEPVGVS